MRNRKGFTLVEVAIALAISAGLFTVIYGTISSAVRGDEALQARLTLQMDAARAMTEATRALKSAGPADVTGDGIPDYPHYFLDSGAVGAFAFVNPPLAAHTATGSDGDEFGPSRQVAFRRVRDQDGDNRATRSTVPVGAIEWSPTTFALVLVTVNGTNELQLRRFDAAGLPTFTQSIARDVERFYVESSGDLLPGAAALDLPQARLTVWFRRPAPGGKILKLKTTATVNYRCQE